MDFFRFIKSVITTGCLLLLQMFCFAHNETNSTWNAVKVFDLRIDEIYNIYIDSLDSASGETVFCFQTTDGKLIKTDIEGKIISTINNPYLYYTLLDGDTLILKDGVVINEKGDTITKTIGLDSKYQCTYIASSPLGIYVYSQYIPLGGRLSFIYNASQYGDNNITQLLSIARASGSFSGLCCIEGKVFGLQSTQENKGILTSRNENYSDEQIQEEIPVNNPVGLTGYKGYLYVFSNTDKALYRLETPNGTGVATNQNQTVADNDNNQNDELLDTIFPLNLDYVVVPNRFFIKKNNDVTQDYIISLLNKYIDGSFQIGWSDDICKIDVDDALIDNAVSELLKEDSVQMARRIYSNRSDYEHYLKYGRPSLENIEVYIFNGITYGIRNGYNQNDMDSIANFYALTNNPNQYAPDEMGMFIIPKTTDIFDLARRLNDTGCFSYISLDMYMKIINPNTTTFNISSKSISKVKETVYYNLSGKQIDSPSGLTIVVTRYTDGTIRTEKKLLR